MSERAATLNTVLRILLTPSCWIRLGPTSLAMTQFIDAMLDAGVVPVRASKWEHTLGGVKLWTRNFPYAFGYLESARPEDGLPSRRAQFRLADAIAAADAAALAALAREAKDAAIERNHQ